MFYWIPQAEQQRFQQCLSYISQLYGGKIFASDMLIALGKNHTFTWDQQFLASFEPAVKNDQERSLIWRLHVLTWAASQATHVEGDFVECGVLHGFCSAVLCAYLDFAKLPRTFYLYDTFTGLPKETSTDVERKNWDYTSLDPQQWVAEVRQRFAALPNVRVIQGVVPDSFQEAAPTKIAFLHLDMNSVRAEMLALEHLFDRIAPGGMIVLDDYGWTCNREQAVAERSFMAARGHAILELPTGQGLIIKH